jgi:hypothetical protein
MYSMQSTQALEAEVCRLAIHCIAQSVQWETEGEHCVSGDTYMLARTVNS